MMTKNMKRVVFYLDKDTQALLKKIPPSYKSFTIRKIIKKAASEGWLGTMVHNAISMMANTATTGPQPDGESPETTSPIHKSDYQSFKRLKRIQPMPTARRYPQPRTSRSFQTPWNLRHMRRPIMVSPKYLDVLFDVNDVDEEAFQLTQIRSGSGSEQEEPKSLNELPMCEVLGERPRADRQTCTSCIVRPCPY